MWTLFLAVVYSLFYFVRVSEEVGIWLTIVTHVFALPSIITYFPSFLSISTFITVIVSVTYHIIKDLYNNDTDQQFRRFDHGWAVFLIYAILFRIYYRKIPEWSIFVLVMISIIPAAFLTMHIPLAILAFIIMLFLLCYNYNRDLLIAFFLFISAAASRYLPIIDNKYHVHSIWHALIFTAVYYAQSGIKHNDMKSGYKAVPEFV